MTKIELKGINALGETVKLSKDVVRFTDDKSLMTISVPVNGQLTLITAKGAYKMKRHTSQNYYHGILNGHKTHVILNKIVGEVIYW